MLAGLAGTWLARVAARVERISGRLRRWAEARAASVASATASAGSSAPELDAPSGSARGDVSSVMDVEHGPPADWLERVRRGAPHLLVAMQRRRPRHGAVAGSIMSGARDDRARGPVARSPVAGGPVAPSAVASVAPQLETATRTARAGARRAAPSHALDARPPRGATSSDAPTVSTPTVRRPDNRQTPSTRGPERAQRARDAETSPPAYGAEPAGRMRWIRWPGPSPVTPPRHPPPAARDVAAASASAVELAGRRAPRDTSSFYASLQTESVTTDVAMVGPAPRMLEESGVARSAPATRRLHTERSLGVQPPIEISEREVPHRRSQPFSESLAQRTSPADPLWPRWFAHPAVAGQPPGIGAAREIDRARAVIDDEPITSAASPDPWPVLLEDEPSAPPSHATTPASADALQRGTRRQEGAPWSV